MRTSGNVTANTIQISIKGVSWAMVRTIILVLGLASAVSLVATLRADDLIAEQFYGSGVHSYFSGNVRAAYDDFTTAIGAGTDYPRPYYFRALTYLRMGRPTDAAADFRKGADLEAADINASYQVSKALERVQGPSRMQLERYRVRARAIAQQRQDQQRRERYAAARRIEMQRVQRAGPKRMLCHVQRPNVGGPIHLKTQVRHRCRLDHRETRLTRGNLLQRRLRLEGRPLAMRLHRPLAGRRLRRRQSVWCTAGRSGEAGGRCGASVWLAASCRRKTA